MTPSIPTTMKASMPEFGGYHPPDVDIGQSMITTVWTLLSLSTVVVSARLYVKLRTIRRIYWDDGLMILALIFGYVHGIAVTQAYHTGLGKHLIYAPLDKLSDTLRVGFFSLAWGFLSPMAGRLSFCTFVLWVKGTDPRVPRWPIFFFMALQVVVNLAQVVVAYAECGTHLSAVWNITNPTAMTTYCWSPFVQSYYGYFSGSINTVTDLFLTILPATIIQHTRMTSRAKLGLACLMCLSFLAMIASVVKTIESRMLSMWSDYTYDYVPYVIWISIELNTVMIVASIPILRPLFRKNGLARIPSFRQVRDTEGRESIPMSSWQRGKGKMLTRFSSMSSEEDILGPRETRLSEFGITRTVEVSVTSAPNTKTFVHAALIGLPMD